MGIKRSNQTPRVPLPDILEFVRHLVVSAIILHILPYPEQCQRAKINRCYCSCIDTRLQYRRQIRLRVVRRYLRQEKNDGFLHCHYGVGTAGPLLHA